MKILLRSLMLGGLVVFAASETKAQVGGAIAVYPENSTLEFTSSRQFSAYVPISPNTVIWSVNDIVGGNAAVGTISASGLYQPPAVIPAANVFSIKARSAAYPSSVGAATVTVTRKYPWLWSVSPSQVQTGNYQVSFNGSNFAPDSQALANGQPVTATYISPTRLVVTGVAAQAGPIQFSVRQPAPGAVTGNQVSVTAVAPTVTVSVTPASTSLPLGASQLFAAVVAGNANTSVSWSVNGIAGGSSSLGFISAGGLYTAPAVLPNPSSVAIRATSQASPSSYAQAVVTLSAPPPITVTITPSSAAVPLSGSLSFSATVAGTSNTAVTWSVNGINGGAAAVGTITAAGAYAAPASLPSPSAVTVRATSQASAAAYAQAQVTLIVPPPPSVSLSAARFLEQSSFGPTPATLARVEQLGIHGYLEEQFNLPAAGIPAPADNSMGTLRRWALRNYTAAPDQLRQRVAYALSQIIVTSGNKLVYADEMLPWLRLLSHHAFGNYRDLLRDVAVSPSMGKYLDLANSLKPGLAGGANENFGRELLQLFTIGLWQLNSDGSLAIDGAGLPIPAYDQETVRQISLALTGWTYATAPGEAPRNTNWEYFGAPMESRAENHDFTAKVILGCALPAGQTVEQDLESVLDCLMHHPNTAPFIATRLIRSLVLSNPSAGYIQRAASVFVNNGSGARGDLKAVVRAILLDPEARNDQPTPNQGRLKEPILQVANLLRALNGQFSASHQLSYLFDYMAQSILSPPSVFSWFSPLYRVPGGDLFGPEFQIYTPTEAVLRGNLFHHILSNPASGDFTVDLSPFQPYGNDMAGLVEKVNQVLLYGRMPAGLKQALITAAAPGYDAKTRIETVLYLAALSGQFAVQH